MCSTDLLVVVRTGDKTLIGKLPSLVPAPFTERLLYRSDRATHWRRVRKQVAAGSRNVWLYYMPQIGLRCVGTDQSISKHQRPLCDDTFYYCDYLRYRFPRCRRHYRLQGQGNPNIHLCGLDSRSIRSRGLAIHSHAIVCTSCWFPSAPLSDLRLSIAAKRMAAQNVLVKDLQGVETLGTSQSSSVTVVIPDASSFRLGEFNCRVLDLAHLFC